MTNLTTSVWPVNAQNEIVAQAGTGGTTVVGYISSQNVLTDTTTNAVVFAGLAGGGASDIAFSTSIPLSSGSTAYMPQTTVTGALNFTPMANAVRNSLVYLRLVANGTNTPTFTGFKEWGSSLGYDNRNGIVNQIQFFNDGYDSYWSGTVAVGATAIDTTPPTFLSAAVSNSTPTIVAITMNETLATGSVPAATAFTVGGHTVSAVAVSGPTVNLTVTSAFVNGEAARQVSYVQPGTNGLRDAAGNLVASFSNQSITNNVASGDVTAPVIQSAIMSGTSLVLTYNEALTSNSPTLTSLSLVVDGAAGVNPTVAAASGTTVTLTFATAVTSGQTLTLGYVPAAVAIKDAAGNNAASLTAYPVTNSTSSGVDVRLINTRLLTESGTTGNYSYTGTGAAFNAGTPSDGAGVLSVAFQNGVDGSFSLVSTVTPVASTGPEIFLGVDAAATVGVYAAIDYAIVNHPTGYSPFANGVTGAPDNTLAAAANDVMRVRRTGTTMVFEVSKNSGSTWTNVKTFTGVPTGVLYVHVRFAYASNAINLTATGLA